MKRPSSILLVLLFFLFAACSKPAKYVFNEGFIYGTIYHITYESPNGLEDDSFPGNLGGHSKILKGGENGKGYY